MDAFQKRINFKGDIKPLLEQVSKEYKLGKYVSHTVISVGYEDFNLILETRVGKFFIKIFNAYRTKSDCERYINIIKKVTEHKVNLPNLLKFDGKFLYEIQIKEQSIRLCVMEYINGKSLYDSKAKLSGKQQKLLIKEITKINQIKFRPKTVYDSWAISNFIKEYKKKRKYLDTRIQETLDLLTKKFSKLSIDSLPYCLVHGDIIKTNVLEDKEGKLFIIDFSVTNYYPRIQELAVLLCSCLFDEKSPNTQTEQRKFALKEYQKYIQLSKKEIAAFPIFCDVAHAMHILQATYEAKVNKNKSEENAYWLKLGKIGLGLK